MTDREAMLREEVARAMRDGYVLKYKPNSKLWDEIDPALHTIWLDHADAALSALRRLPSPEEGVTEEMVERAAEAMFDSMHGRGHTWGSARYPGQWRIAARAALLAALHPSKEGK